MKHFPAIESWVLGLLAVCLLAGTAEAENNSEPDASDRRDATKWAKEILDTTGVQGGIVVHLGCGDGKLTAALRVSDRYTVHGLEADPAKVAEARSYIQTQSAGGGYGPVSIERYSASTLPYTDNLINLIVVQDADKVGMDEVMRVLAAGGVACVRRNGKWEKTVKAWPDNVDQWTHFLHDASNNAVANDSVVGPPQSLQWVAPPLWLRSHETPSGIQSPVSAAGRLFYFFDEGLIGITDERLPDRWSLICRDAFNGKLLWKRSLDSWGWREWSLERWQGKDWTTLRAGRTDVPAENQRRIVADADRLYVTLGYRAPMSILDAATGDIITTVEATRDTSEILFSNGVAVAYTQEVAQGNRTKGGAGVRRGGLVAVQGWTRKVLWQKQIGQIRPLALAINNGRIVYLTGRDLVARDLKDGSEMWRIQPKWTTPRTLLTVDDVVVMQGGKWVSAYDATDVGLARDAKRGRRGQAGQ